MMSSDIKVRKLHLLSHCVCWVCFTLFTQMKNGFWKAEIKQTTKALTLAVVSVGNIYIYISRYNLHIETQCFAVNSVFTPYWSRCSAAVACRGKMRCCMMLEHKQ